MTYTPLIKNQNYEILYKVVRKRHNSLKKYSDLIPSEIKKKQFFSEPAIDLIHMTVNRILPIKNRLHELILYDFLKRHYNSVKARKNNAKKPSQ